MKYSEFNYWSHATALEGISRNEEENSSENPSDHPILEERHLQLWVMNQRQNCECKDLQEQLRGSLKANSKLRSQFA